ncbi:MAG: UDP-N-acetylmuramoyl-L-alanyl-D-glutamate--2,6-diaminopimelate ligase [Lentisphaeria bacterium]|nr:UDP-N-acetylmuramoyl-L-alanyl-D-glutamate--2,6-diaminopimelate ligase [Lentisphaeria bacterium]
MVSCSLILKELLIEIRGRDVPFIPDVVTDSRKLSAGCIFVAVPGSRFDGHDFIIEAEKTASVIVHSRPLQSYCGEKTYYLVSDASAATALLFREKYGRPDTALDLFGVTGTNGKTTTTFILEHLLENCGLLSTVAFRDGKKETPATHTTPDPETLFCMLKRMRDNHLSAAALELSSHALHQNRARGTRFRAAIFTNLTGDHLDYHHDMESYYQAKKIFFTQLLAPDGIAVINTDDPAGRRLAEELEGVRRVVTFGTSDACWLIKKLHTTRSGMTFELVSGKTVYSLETNLAGKFNAFNLAGAILAVLDYGISFDRIAGKLHQKITVPGRLQFLDAPTGAAFAVDFAHTDDALTNVLSTLRPLTENKLFCVFGAGGNRDKTKRPRMGKAAAENADYLIVTSDNPRTEDPEDIIRDIVAGIPPESCFEIQPDRKAAIRRAFELAGPGDIVLVAGKGHENYQEINGVKYPFSDTEVITACFKGEI